MAGPEGEEEELEAGRGYGAGPRGGDGRRGASTATTSATTTTCRYARVRRSSFRSITLHNATHPSLGILRAAPFRLPISTCCYTYWEHE